MLMGFLIYQGSIFLIVLCRFDHETDEEFAIMDRFEKKLLSLYSNHLDNYDPMEEGLFESWNWSSNLDVQLLFMIRILFIAHEYNLEFAQI